ncbi:SDR family mycofactocin-dependent oxidoreductase [Nocardia transvalensis]|uniref:SDR family mycofactocin-dependent oxidoreductase n=1 Tax=Nocardia transvalensis TaxID=37333 RepID=A0A7W9UN11_9NOCA|nr:mycofactocin-coupled SDR family oxidoreductase [Nocardia transvalensis]MBB5918345.1 SDR family mycofactocin-dependent oxidoreductase [Nocardia transvalensis]
MIDAPVAVVTGAARGIGAATVHRLADAGWRVVAVDACADDPRVPYALATREQLRSVARAHNGFVDDVVADVRDLDALIAVVRSAEERFGRLDAAVAAAAVMTGGGRPLWETVTADWAPMFDVGVHGVANLARAAVPAMLRRPAPRTGRFVALASAAAHHGMWRLAGYNAAKHAVAGLVKGLAHDLRGTGVTAVAVSPGSTRTDLLTESARLYDLDTVDDFADHQLLGRILEPAEIAATVAWLCAPESACVTGSVIHADGGFLP